MKTALLVPALISAVVLASCEQPTEPTSTIPVPSGQPSLSLAPNEPSGYKVMTDWEMTTATSAKWKWRNSIPSGVIARDSSDPGTAPKVLRFNTGPTDTTSLNFIGGFARGKEHTGFWWKGTVPVPLVVHQSQITDLGLGISTHNGTPVVVVFDTQVQAADTAHENSDCGPWDTWWQCTLYGNVNGYHPVTMGEWHYFEWDLEAGLASQGRIRWWIDGDLVGDYRFGVGLQFFGELQVGRHMGGPARDRGSFDDVRVSAPHGKVRKVTDLHGTGAALDHVALEFTNVDDGTGRSPKSEIRYAPTPIGWGWGSATVTTEGTCRSPLGVSYVGTVRTCTVEGLEAGRSYDFQLVGFREEDGERVFGPLSNVTTIRTSAAGSSGPPGAVNDLEVYWTESNEAWVRFTTVDDGEGHGANYQIRYARTPMGWGWGSAGIPAAGSCGTVYHDSGIGQNASCSIQILASSTSYDFQLVAFRETESGNVFGPLSNIATGVTKAEATTSAAVR